MVAKVTTPHGFRFILDAAAVLFFPSLVFFQRLQEIEEEAEE
jgi:hypothetical protein